MTKPLSQAQRILRVLQDANGEWISACYFKRDLWITETNARISELRQQGYDIETKDERDEHGFAYHRLAPVKKMSVDEMYDLYEPKLAK